MNKQNDVTIDQLKSDTVTVSLTGEFVFGLIKFSVNLDQTNQS